VSEKPQEQQIYCRTLINTAIFVPARAPNLAICLPQRRCAQRLYIYILRDNQTKWKIAFQIFLTINVARFTRLNKKILKKDFEI